MITLRNSALLAAMCLFLAVPVSADITNVDDADITVTVEEVNLLEVVDDVSVVLDVDSVGDANYMQRAAVNLEINYSMNTAAGAELDFEVTGEPADGGDITLTLDGTEIVASGAGQGPGTLRNVDQGSGKLELPVTASASVAGTAAGSYTWTVKLTMNDG